jgi:serine/threonine protein kinase/Tol biopolymer transport system component/tetratricopeptide (TPR) repeat protein
VVTTLNKIRLMFCECVEKQTEQERRAYLDEACRGDPSLRAEIDALLTAHYGQDDLLSGPILGSPVSPDDSLISEGPGTVIGHYKLLEKIGEGGMAVVYMAEQTEPIRRKVALKIIKLGMDTRQVIARFEAERQALALMDHPSIAKILDAGATETGRPYFVMELVQGVSITEYCDRNSLSTKERLTLFLQVCHAVQHAHQKGIIHRDIKPSNVMVTHRDGEPIPKVIDFGIAKATNQRLTEKTLFTRYAHLIGTPAYMSPEQAELSDLDIDTRTDIYSLGVLLYELLTGTTPFSEEELRKAGYVEMQHVIREQEPIKPSTKLSTLGDTLTDVAKHRGCTPELLRKAVRGDLDWIVMKSLEKDRARRYETASNLAEDIRRHLEHEPILARGPSTTYRLGRFLRRHRGQTIAALATVVIAGAAVVLLSLWNRDRLRLTEADRLRHQALLSQARGQYAKGERQAALETIRSIFDSRHVGPDARLLCAGILAEDHRPDEAAAIVGNLVHERAEIAGAAHALWARILWENETPEAQKRAEIEDHRHKAEALLPRTAEAYFLRAITAATIKGQLAALDKALQLVSINPEPLNQVHYESRRLRAFTYYASREYEKMKDDAFAMTILRPHDPAGYFLHAVARQELGRYPEAVADFNSAMIRTAESDPQYLDLAGQQCEALLRQGDYERVVANVQDALKLAPDRRVFQYCLFAALTALGDYDRAAGPFRQIIGPNRQSRQRFADWCGKYVFDTLAAGRSWHPPGPEPAGAAFLPLVESQEAYRDLSAKAKLLIPGGFTAQWSPDGKKLAFSVGVEHYSGVAVYNPATKTSELLILPGSDPKWSPDQRYIAFTRDRQVLRVPEFVAAERTNRSERRPKIEQEIWIMKADGNEPRYLARGGWPSWGKDSTCVYYHSHEENRLCSISVGDRDAQPRQIMACQGSPTVSPDGKHAAYVEGASLKVKDLASQRVIAEWPTPAGAWGAPAWSKSGDEVSLGTLAGAGNRTGLWIYCFGEKEPVRVLAGPIWVSSWSPQGRQLVFNLGPPYYGIWTVDLEPNASTTAAREPGQTLEEYLWEMVAFYSRRIEADPQDAYSYSSRAEYYDCLHEDAKATADMQRWSATISGSSPSDLPSTVAPGPGRAINDPLDRQVAFSAGVTFGTPTNLGPAVNSPSGGLMPYVSPDGLELYFSSNRPGGYGGFDIWVARRANVQDPWGAPINLGPPVNTEASEAVTGISADGLTLYVHYAPPRYGSQDLSTSTRATKDAPWHPRVDLGPGVNSPYTDRKAVISADNRELYFTSDRPGGYGSMDIWVGTRASDGDPWEPPENPGPTINTPYQDWCGWVSPDGLTLFLVSDRPGGYGGLDIWIATRQFKGSSWGPPTNAGPSINTTHSEFLTSVSPDGKWCYFHSNRPGGYGTQDIWQAPIMPRLDTDAAVKGKED